MNFKRLFTHLFTTRFPVKRAFPKQALEHITEAVGKCENQHHGEIRVAIEPALHLPALWHNVSARQRALEVFAHLRVWDTEANSGVLIYLLWADRQVEIIADRGVNGKVGSQGFDEICKAMEKLFRQGHFEAGVIAGIERVSEELIKYFPRTGKEDKNELPDAPVML